MYVNNAQKFFTYLGYYLNVFARKSIRSLEKLMRPLPESSYWKKIRQWGKEAACAIFSIPLALILSIPAFACYILAACAGQGRFELIRPQSPSIPWQHQSIKVMSVNACFQDPWSPWTAGIVTPMEPVGNFASRVAAIVNIVAQEDPILFLGQEFENLSAQNEFIRLMQQAGFSYFLRDLGSNDPVRNNSGLFIASKIPLENIEFVPYPSEDRTGLAKWSQQGALTFTISMQEHVLRFVNVHLNYGKKNQAARNCQLMRHVVPLLKKGRSVLFGDLNFNTASTDRFACGLLGFINELEGKVSCTDGEESLDALIYNPDNIQILNSALKPLASGNQFLSDHYATLATLQILL